MAESQLPPGGKQHARMIMRECLADALTYYARVCCIAVYEPDATRLRADILAVATAVAGQTLSADGAMQWLLRREEGGVDLHDPVQSGVRARAAAVMERGSILRAALHGVYPGVEKAQLMQVEGVADADASTQRSASQGIASGA